MLKPLEGTCSRNFEGEYLVYSTSCPKHIDLSHFIFCVERCLVLIVIIFFNVKYICLIFLCKYFYYLCSNCWSTVEGTLTLADGIFCEERCLVFIVIFFFNIKYICLIFFVKICILRVQIVGQRLKAL